MNVNESFWFRFPLSQALGVELLVVVWPISSRLVQRTPPPTGMLMLTGAKRLPWMFTCAGVGVLAGVAVGTTQDRLETALYTILAICPLIALLPGLKYLPGHGSPGPPQE